LLSGPALFADPGDRFPAVLKYLRQNLSAVFLVDATALDAFY